MTRYVTPLTKLAAAALLALWSALPAQGQEVSLSVAQARQVALQALTQGQPALAAQIAGGLLQRDSGDAFAHFVLARAFQQLKQPRAGRREAALAFRHTNSGRSKYQASQLAATLAYEGGQPGLAQLWLRRSWNHAPDDRARQILERDYRVLRALNPWSVQARLSVTPSDNVNNGAQDPYALIDGVPVIGILSGDAMALSGVKSVAELSLGYRFAHSEVSQTRATGRLYLSRVALSDAARDQAPTARNSDFSYSVAELGLEHRRSLGEARGLLTLEAQLSQSWYGGAAYQTALRLGVGRSLPLGSGGRLTLAASLEQADPANGAPAITQLDLRAGVTQKLAAGGTLSTGLSLQWADSESLNARRQRLTGYVAYALAQPVGPARVSFSLGGTLGQYPDYRVGPIIVPGGRDDQTLFGSADFVFENLDYAGFVPSLKVQAQKTLSNVSRFETREISVSLGIVSRF